MKTLFLKQASSQAKSTLTKPFFQPKLTVGDANDIQEREADAMAEKVMQTPQNAANSSFFKPVISSIQRKCSKCEEEEKLQKKSDNGASAGIQEPSTVHDVINSGGQTLDTGTRNFFEPRFGHDFSGVRIHTNSMAAKSAQHINALAYTTGNNIVFNQNQFSPETNQGKKLLAHELTHVLQQDETIHRMPRDPFGRPLGFVPNPEQEAYDKETAEIDEWKKVLARLDKGELDDKDMANARLRNRLTGLTSAEVSTLVTNIKAYQARNPQLVVDRIVSWLEVRKEISTPMPDGATVNKDPLLNTIDSYSLNIGKVKVIVAADTFGNKQNDTAPVTSFGKNYNYAFNSKNIITALNNKDSGSDVAINPTSFEITILTSYHDNPNGTSGYGKGTQQSDKDEKTTTLRVHEGSHGSDYLDYIRSTPFPVDISKGVVGVLTVADMKKIDNYINGITKASCEATDQVGFSQDEFLKTTEGKASGITSCRKH